TVAYVGDVLSANAEIPALRLALRRVRVRDVRAELESIVGELYDVLARHRRGIKLIDRSAVDHPQFGAPWFEGAAGGLREALATYLAARVRRGLLRPVVDVAIAARMILEMLVFWAVHRHWDPHPQPVDEALARTSVIQFVVGALVSLTRPRPRSGRGRTQR